MAQDNQRSSSPKLDINELASQLGVSTATLYRWRSTGADMPRGFKVGARVRWTQQSVDDWIDKQMAN